MSRTPRGRGSRRLSDALQTAGSAVTLPNEDLVAEAVRFTRSFQRLLTRGGGSSLSYDRARVLETLHCNGPQRMRDIADQVDLPARNLTAVADSLEMEHLVRRTPHPTDRRATLLEVTDAGRSAIENAMGPRLMGIDALFDVLSATEKARLLSGLKRLVDAMDEVAAEPT
jgi:DNA-binding MarR family transcriptional regulator